ncbi:hypothetical protein RHSIM_Rhsim12G0009300 [Rhododendron simsii]|uniref:Uncharacterized protein n=1 Tax=Rhododendron simsii TaxID=118357 RepID=A0A834G3Y3_RHOSS|nr:hypothetical protein RHSIM_Rhsim12G0009300 [Rhododendron simsii]
MKAWEAAKKRADSLFGPTHVAHEEEDDDNEDNENPDRGHEKGDIYNADRVLANGNYYTGHWSDNFPHGLGPLGKYLWTDGCMYIGEWYGPYGGKTMGKRKVQLAFWGHLRRRIQEQLHGRKRHVHGIRWRDVQGALGHEFEARSQDQELRERGLLRWRMVSRVSRRSWFGGYREDGFPKGNGTLRWANGSTYVGNWNRDPNEQNGTYFPFGSSTPEENLDWDPQDVFNVDLSD